VPRDNTGLEAGLGEALRTVVAAAPQAARAVLGKLLELPADRVLSNPGDVAGLVTAVRAWSELPHS
jgi:hypothetical protein